MSVERLLKYYCTDPRASILDLGCGKGALVESLRAQGYDAYGCDIEDVEWSGSEFRSAKASVGYLRSIEMQPYKLPFDENKFDFVISSQVLEHVMDYECTFAEIHRVLKPGGISLHTFPGRHLIIEPHTYVPLATIVRNKSWLYLWAILGIRNKFQTGKSASEVVRINFKYLHAHTNYLSAIQIKRHAKCFTVVKFCENIFFTPMDNNESLKKRLFVVLGGDKLRVKFFGSFISRALYLRK